VRPKTSGSTAQNLRRPVRCPRSMATKHRCRFCQSEQQDAEGDSAMTQSVLGDPVSPAAKSNPYPGLRVPAVQPAGPLRHAARRPSALADHPLWRRRTSAVRSPTGEDQTGRRPCRRGPATDEQPVSADPPDHALLRVLVRKAFSPRLIERLRPRIQQIADELSTQSRRPAGWT
jgi:cytochrome P450